jgi:hypothetical protein
MFLDQTCFRHLGIDHPNVYVNAGNSAMTYVRFKLQSGLMAQLALLYASVITLLP